MALHREWPAILYAFLLACLLTSCSRQAEPRAASRRSTQDPELGLENQIQKLFGDINDQQRNVNTLIRAAGPELTPATRNQARAARYELYEADKYVQALRTAQEAFLRKFATIAGTNYDAAKFQTNRALGDARTNELAAENDLKAAFLQMRAAYEEQARQGDDAKPTTQAQDQTAAIEPYSPEDYVAALRLASMLMERKVDGFRAEAAFYQKMLGLDADNNPLPK